jgi:hypothetical protein
MKTSRSNLSITSVISRKDSAGSDKDKLVSKDSMKSLKEKLMSKEIPWILGGHKKDKDKLKAKDRRGSENECKSETSEKMFDRLTVSDEKCTVSGSKSADNLDIVGKDVAVATSPTCTIVEEQDKPTTSVNSDKECLVLSRSKSSENIESIV